MFSGENILRMEPVWKSTRKLLRIETTHLLFSLASFCSSRRLAVQRSCQKDSFLLVTVNPVHALETTCQTKMQSLLPSFILTAFGIHSLHGPVPQQRKPKFWCPTPTKLVAVCVFFGSIIEFPLQEDHRCDLTKRQRPWTIHPRCSNCCFLYGIYKNNQVRHIQNNLWGNKDFNNKKLLTCEEYCISSTHQYP